MACNYPRTMFNGSRMRSRRESLKLTRAELARRVEESESMLGNWERGENEPRSRAITKIAVALGVSTDYLFGLTDEPSPGGVDPIGEHFDQGIDARQRRRSGNRPSNGSPRENDPRP